MYNDLDKVAEGRVTRFLFLQRWVLQLDRDSPCNRRSAVYLYRQKFVTKF